LIIEPGIFVSETKRSQTFGGGRIAAAFALPNDLCMSVLMLFIETLFARSTQGRRTAAAEGLSETAKPVLAAVIRTDRTMT
jgi:hypothetical protein